MLAFIESFNKIGSKTNVLERKKLKYGNPESRSPGIPESQSSSMRYRRNTFLKTVPFQFMKMDNWVPTKLFSILDTPIIILPTVVDKKVVNSLSGP